MSDTVTKDTLNDHVRELLDKISQFNPADLTKHPDLGKVNFETSADIVRQAVDSASMLRLLPIELLSQEQLATLKGSLLPVVASLDRMAAFGKQDHANARDARNQIAESLRNSWIKPPSGEIPPYLVVFSLMAYLGSQTPKFAKNLDEYLEASVTKASSLVAGIETVKAQAEQTLKTIQDTAAETGAAKFAKVFKDVADKHRLVAYGWLAASVLFGGLTAIVGFRLAQMGAPAYLTEQSFMSAPDHVVDRLATFATMQFIAGRLVVLSMLYLGALWSVRNYRAHRHLSVVNDHRQNALSTFETFVKSAGGDQDTKNAVLMEATRCIFAPAVSGYLGPDDDASSNRIVEIMKIAGGKADR